MTMATVTNLPGHDQYEKVRRALQSGNRSQIDKALETLVKACGQKRESHETKPKVDDDQLQFWVDEIMRLLFDWENALTRDLALKASEAIVPHLEPTLYQESTAWPALKTTISSNYSGLLEQARGRNDPEWHRKWVVLVRLLDKEICQGAMIINVFLAIVESGFRSAELLVREQSFDCWRLLVEIFARYNQIHLPKRIKLICIPLKSSKSKTEAIAKKKFEIWWFLVNQLQAQLDTIADNVFEPFIYFCFGPSFKTPLCYYFDDSYQEFGAPGKIYNSIKQLSAIALIHMLGPAPPALTETLLHEGSTRNGVIPFKAPADTSKPLISPKLFTLKAKLIINSCTECTVLFAQMRDKNYLQLNQCLWENLLAMVAQEGTLGRRPEMLGWIRDNLAALVSLSVLQKDEVIRELVYDTVRMVSQTDLMAVTIGQDSPEQLVNNYKTIMPLIFNADLDYPEGTSSEILTRLFDLRRYSSPSGGYWDMLQKTVQYLTDLDQSLFTESKAPSYRRFVTQIYRALATHLREQINTHRDQFEQSQAAVFGFLLYPLEYDRFLVVDDVRDPWKEVYAAIVASGGNTNQYACSFSEMIKAMTVAKYNANLGVILEFFRVVLESVRDDFESGESAPVKTLELLKDLVRKALVFQNSLEEVGKTIGSFRALLERMSIKGLLAVIMPVRNVVHELVSGENEKLEDEVKATLKKLTDRLVAAKFVAELKGQPNEVKWNCKMLIGMLLELPSGMQKQWKVADLKKLVDICEGKEPPASKPPKPVKKEGEFVVIEKVWKFTPDKLTEHQRDRMREKRDDIPALYNDMSQSQDSFVIKPWTPNKIVIPADSKNDHDTIVMCADSNSVSAANGTQEASVPKEEGSTGGAETTVKLDKENNNGNVVEGTSGNTKRVSGKKTRQTRELNQLKIDTIEGKTLTSTSLTRTRRSESLEPSGPPTRSRKTEPKKRPASATPVSTDRLRTRKQEKMAVKEEPAEPVEGSPIRKKPEEKPKSPAERTSPRKSLNFDNVIDREPTVATEAPGSTKSPIKAQATNESIDEVIESSQQQQPESQSVLARSKFAPRKAKEEDVGEVLATDSEMKEEQEVVVSPNRKSPIKAKLEAVEQSPSKNTRSAVQQKISEMDTEPNTEIPETEPIVETVEPEIELPPLPESPVTRSKSPKKEKRSDSPVPEPMETDEIDEPQSPHKPEATSDDDEEELVSPNLSPIRENLDDEMDPLAKAINRSLVSSPEAADQDEREADLLNSTLNISPIPEEEAQPSTPSTSAAQSTATAGSNEKRASSRIMEREKTSTGAVAPSPVTRRTRSSPPGMPIALINLKLRTPQQMVIPRSPSTNRIELRGRGAQLINLIRNQQSDVSPKTTASTPQNSSTPKPAGPSTPASSDRSLMMRKLATAGAAAQSPEQPKPLEKDIKEKDYLVFTKVLPSPQASPAASILKRKFNHDDSGDDADSSPANKRKRVSFHDPPVSVTKEYIRQEGECRSPSITRCLQLTGLSSPADKAKFLLRRKSKADSLSELFRFTGRPAGESAKDEEEEISSSPESLDGEFVINTTDNMSALQVTTTDADGGDANEDIEMKDAEQVVAPEVEPIAVPELPKRTSPRKISPKTETEKPAITPVLEATLPTPVVLPLERPDPSIRFQSEDELLSHVLSTYSLDSIVERYLAAGKSFEQPKTTRVLTRELSTLMAKDAKTRHTVLDELSERHSEEFLDHAVQENSSTMVCQRLSMTTMTEYIFAELRKLPPMEDVSNGEQHEERVRVLQTMFDQLLQMDQYVKGQALVEARDRFVRAVVCGKSSVEVMELLREYFGGSSSSKAGSSENAAST